MSGSEAPGYESYVEWKNWGHKFGSLERGDSKYFTKELREIERRGEIHDVLELGFGDGRFLAYCRERGWQATGIELIPELVELAKSSGFGALLADQVATLPDASFDLIAAFDVLEHIPPSDSVEFLTGIRQKLRPGGSVILRFPNADTALGNPFQYGDPTHVNAIGLLKLRYYAASAELQVSRFRGSKGRSFETSLVHGLHRYTGLPIGRVLAGIKRAIYLPDVPVVLSSPNVIAVLRLA
ncbi:MAG TPA: class I SAM-dependent methyltransferase [Microbacteriaceae bacterium]|nr:class I SAM-dependent methyltransferase [Microbacteriaceae bacterium]